MKKNDKKLFYCLSGETNPYANLALEEFLLWDIQKGEHVLYLWQNHQTVVIGINQNPWKECFIRELEADGGFLARRMSGGGAVYHDLGNLNFTFLTLEENYAIDKQLDVIVRAVKKLGIQAEKSGRNDLSVDGKKFSGNAFFHSRGHCFHHGTLLVDVNLSNLSKYLNVAQAKLQSKGVNSVRSRVINLKERSPSITIETLQNALIEAFGEIYGGQPFPFPSDRLNHQQITALEEKYASRDWLLGRKLPFTAEYQTRFSWGDLTLQFCVEKGIIVDAIAYSDIMDTPFIQNLGHALIGLPFSSSEINDRLLKLPETTPVENAVLRDITHFISENNI